MVIFHFPLILLIFINEPRNLIGNCVFSKVPHWLGKDAILSEKWCDS